MQARALIVVLEERNEWDRAGRLNRSLIGSFE